MENKKLQVIFEAGLILDVIEYTEGNAFLAPAGKGVLIHDDKGGLETMLGALGITDFSKMSLLA